MKLIQVTFRIAFLKRCAAFAALLLLVLAAAGGAGLYYWATEPLRLPEPVLDFTLKADSSVRGVARQLEQAGIPVVPRLFVAMTRALGLGGSLKAGNYEFKRGITRFQLLQKLALQDPDEGVETVPEGWSFRRMRAEFDAQPALRHDSAGMSDADLLRAIGAPDEVAAHANGEGLFFPETYLFDKGISDLNLYRRAYRLMQQRLAQAWEKRAAGLPYRTPYEALTAASLIEKETAKPADRPLVSAVFVNRLRQGMPLQTDPAVIYGLGPAYDGHLRKSDLAADTPYNTYTRRGLPPTPIALPGMASLLAAVRPAASGALYFVARPDGSSAFSDTLDAHHAAVQHYLRGQ